MNIQSNKYKFLINSSSQTQIFEHLKNCSKLFKPDLKTYVDLEKYSEKIFNNSTRFELYFLDSLIGLLAVYQKTNEVVFITNLSIEEEHNGIGLAKQLLISSINNLANNGTKEIELEVFKQNEKAKKFYFNNSFKIVEESTDKYILKLKI